MHWLLWRVCEIGGAKAALLHTSLGQTQLLGRGQAELLNGRLQLRDNGVVQVVVLRLVLDALEDAHRPAALCQCLSNTSWSTHVAKSLTRREACRAAVRMETSGMRSLAKTLFRPRRTSGAVMVLLSKYA